MVGPGDNADSGNAESGNAVNRQPATASRPGRFAIVLDLLRKALESAWSVGYPAGSDEVRSLWRESRVRRLGQKASTARGTALAWFANWNHR